MDYRSGTRNGILLGFVLGFASLFLAVALVSRDKTTQVKGSPDATPETIEYLAELDLSRYETRGTSFTDPRLSPFRILPKLTQRDVVYHYDFDRLQQVEQRLRGVDRHMVLKEIFQRLTAECPSDRERHLAVLRFLQKASFHNLIQPMRDDGQMVCDPLVLLELGEMRCGQVNRIAVDLFRTAGYRARLVQAAFHVLAEVYYDDSWHYFDASIFGNGELVILPDGHVPSMHELAAHAEKLDALTAFWQPDHANSPLAEGTTYPTWQYFSARAYQESEVEPATIEKTATSVQEADSEFFGWNYFEIIPDPDRPLNPDGEKHLTCVAPRITGIDYKEKDGKRLLSLAWQGDPRAVYYCVFLSSTTRGWNYDGESLPPDLMSWKSQNGPWQPEMYEARYRELSSDLGMHETRGTQISMELPSGKPVYLSVMAIDARGARVQRKLMPVSEELMIP